MNDKEVKVIEIIASSLGKKKEDILSKTLINEGLNISSLEMIEIIFAIETDFDIGISPQQTTEFKTVQDIFNFVNQASIN